MVAFIALAASEFDVNDEGHMAMLQPFDKVLDRAWLIPMHASRLYMLMGGGLLRVGCCFNQLNCFCQTAHGPTVDICMG